MSGFPWDAAMRLGLGRLRLSPREFWAMTLRELAAAAGPMQAPMSRGELERMMAKYPDDGQGEGNGRDK